MKPEKKSGLFFQASLFQLLKLEIHCEDHISPLKIYSLTNEVNFNDRRNQSNARTLPENHILGITLGQIKTMRI